MAPHLRRCSLKAQSASCVSDHTYSCTSCLRNSLQGPSWNFMSHLVYVDTPSVACRCFSFLIYPQEQPIIKFNSFKATAEFFGEDVGVFLWPLWFELLLLLCGLVFLITKQAADGQVNNSLEMLSRFPLFTQFLFYCFTFIMGTEWFWFLLVFLISLINYLKGWLIAIWLFLTLVSV